MTTQGTGTEGPGIGLVERPLTQASREGTTDRFWGCGWFDSSHDLQQGLTVVEHRDVEAELAVALLFDPCRRRRAGAAAVS